jgi:hypothetical protein
MAKPKRKRIQKRLLYFFLNKKLYKIIRANRSRDELVAWCYPDHQRVLFSYAQVDKYAERAYTVKEVADMLNRHKITIENYILNGKIRQPTKAYPISNPESSWNKFLMSEEEILDLHEFISLEGHSGNLPSKNEVKALLKHNIILYTKTDSGFVPVWKAE